MMAYGAVMDNTENALNILIRHTNLNKRKFKW